MTPSDFGATQVVEDDVNAFAGADSLLFTGSFVSSTVNAGAGADTLFINTSTAGATASSATSFYGGAGADLDHRQLTLQTSPSTVTVQLILLVVLTALGSVTSATVYGAAGADTLHHFWLDLSASTLDGGTGVSDFELAAGVTADRHWWCR